MRVVAEPLEVEGGVPQAAGVGWAAWWIETIIFAPDEFARKALSKAETSSSSLLVRRTSLAGRIWASSCATARLRSASEKPFAADVSCVPAAVGGVNHDGPGEEVLREVAPALVRELVGA